MQIYAFESPDRRPLEISKASSQNVKLNLMNVDIVNLFKQVKFELEGKFEEKRSGVQDHFPERKK